MEIQIEDEDLASMVREVEITGGWKSINWLLSQIQKNMTGEQIREQIEHIKTCLNTELAGIFTSKHLFSIQKQEKEKTRGNKE